MSLDQLRIVNFGKSNSNATGSTGVGYALLDVSGSVIGARTTVGVFQTMSGSGIYAANISFPDYFRGMVSWDTGSAFATTSYASEQYNYEENNPLVQETYIKLNVMSGSLEVIRQFTEGRWMIDETTNQMLFYDKDNTTLVATFDLKDSVGSPSYDSVFERVRA